VVSDPHYAEQRPGGASRKLKIVVAHHQGISAVPSGLWQRSTDLSPNVETLGYCHDFPPGQTGLWQLPTDLPPTLKRWAIVMMSLRDKQELWQLPTDLLKRLNVRHCHDVLRGQSNAEVNDNSPTFQHWERMVINKLVLKLDVSDKLTRWW